MEFSLTIQRILALRVLCIASLVLAGFLFIGAKPVHSSSCSVHAGGSDCDAFNDAGSTPQNAATPRMLGNSVDIVTGNNYQNALDFKAADSFLSFKRHYNSVNAGFNVGLGAGWRSTYDVTLIDGKADKLSIIQSDGRIIEFRSADSDTDQIVASEKPQRYLTTNPSDGILYRQGAFSTWQLPDKRTLHFKGKFLTQIDFESRHRLKLFYRNQRLSTVTDETGRQIRYQYTEGYGLSSYQPDAEFTTHPGHLERIILPDESAIEFFYDSHRNLRKVTQGDESVLQYEYQAGLYPGYLSSSAENSIVQKFWQYHSDGTVASLEDIPNALDMTLNYHTDSDNPSTGYTQVTDTKGNIFKYLWAERRPEFRLKNGAEKAKTMITSTEGSRCIGCPVIKPSTTLENQTTDFSTVIYPSSIVSLLEELKGRIITTDILGFPEQVEFDSSIDGDSRIVRFDFSAKGKIKSITTRGEDESSITFRIKTSNKATDTQNSTNPNQTANKPQPVSSINELDPAANLLYDLATELDKAGDFNTRYYNRLADDHSATNTTPPSPTGLPGQPTPGNPPLCTDVADCDAINRALFYYDFSYCVYTANRPCNNTIPEGWEYVDPLEAGPDGSADISNLTADLDYDAAVYYNESENRVIIAYSGSDQPSDFGSGLQLFTGGNSYQAETALALASAVNELYPDSTIETTGHSLGGGLAILAASMLNEERPEVVEGVIFGSLGIDEQTAEVYGVPWETTDQIDHFYVDRDFVGDPPSWHFSITHSNTGLAYESNLFLPARAVTYELSQPPSESWNRFEAHRMANLATTLQHHHSELGCE